MVFKRRTPRSLSQRIVHGLWPQGGWGRAARYMNHRLRRLPDPPHRIARGVFSGILASFSPLFGLHFGVAAAIAWVLRGNMVAALISTLVGNPITFPFIATASIELGNWILGHGGEMQPLQIFEAFGQAGAELTANFWAIFTGHQIEWVHFHRFLTRVFWPYFLGGLGPGVVAGLVGYFLTLPVVTAYQTLRRKRLTERYERNRAQRLALEARKADLAAAGPSEHADGGDVDGRSA